MKRELLGLCALIVICMGLFWPLDAITEVTLHSVRIGGTGGSYVGLTTDPADTIAGTSHKGGYRDTTYSDTVNISDYDYVTIAGRLRLLDTGVSYGGDSIGDTCIVSTFTSISKGTALWLVTKDTITFTGDSFRHHYKTDTMLYNDVFFRSIVYDTGTVQVLDMNKYYFDLDIIGR